MPEDMRFEAAMVAATQVLERLDSRPEAELPERLSITVYLVLEAIYDSERRLAELKQWFYREIHHEQ